MTRYALAIAAPPSVRAAVEVVRRYSEVGVSEIARRIGEREPVIEFDTWGFDVGEGYDQGVSSEHAKLRRVIEELEGLGASVTIIRRTRLGDHGISRSVLENMLQSELIDLKQEYD
jgi:hypothetical protein